MNGYGFRTTTVSSRFYLIGLVENLNEVLCILLFFAGAHPSCLGWGIRPRLHSGSIELLYGPLKCNLTLNECPPQQNANMNRLSSYTVFERQ